jgi:hypothetical protein
MTVPMPRVSNPFFRLLSALSPSDLLRSESLEGTVTKAFEWASKAFPQWMGTSPIDTAQVLTKNLMIDPSILPFGCNHSS